MSVTVPCRSCLPQNCDGFGDDFDLFTLYSLEQPPFEFFLNCPPGFDCQNAPFLLLECCGDRILVDLLGVVGPQRRQMITEAFTRCSQLWDFCGQRTGIFNRGRRQDTYFYNDLATCQVPCPDGSIFAYQVGAGNTAALDQATANTLALQFACQLASQRKICLPDMDTYCCKGKPFSKTLVPTGPGVFVFSISAGALPPGLTLSTINNRAAVISGTPPNEGDYTFTLRAMNSLGNFMEKSYYLPVLGFSPILLPEGHVNTFYNANLTPAGGTPGWRFGVSGPPFPQPPLGITVFDSGLVNGKIDAGVAPGDYPFNVTLEDSHDPRRLCIITATITVDRFCNLPIVQSEACVNNPSLVGSGSVAANTYCGVPGGGTTYADMLAMIDVSNQINNALNALTCGNYFTVVSGVKQHPIITINAIAGWGLDIAIRNRDTGILVPGCFPLANVAPGVYDVVTLCGMLGAGVNYIMGFGWRDPFNVSHSTGIEIPFVFLP